MPIRFDSIRYDREFIKENYSITILCNRLGLKKPINTRLKYRLNNLYIIFLNLKKKISSSFLITLIEKIKFCFLLKLITL
jgi:hypothetical protein